MWPFGSNSGNSPVPLIPYTHTISNKARRLTIKIGRSGQVVVVTPRYMPKLVIDQFVAEHQDWISEKLAAFKKIKKNADTVSIYGKEYQKIVTYLPQQKLGILIKGGKVIFNSPEVSFHVHSKESVGKNALERVVKNTARGTKLEETISWGKAQEKALERFLKSTAQVYIIKRTEQLAQKMKVTYGNITLREQSSRWGSCSSMGNLNFNWRLVHAEPQIIDYVIVHELAHRVHMDHSRNFWNLVAKFDPEYQVHRGWLKRQGHALS